MAYEYVIGLEVVDDALYQRYRDGMRRFLEEYGGAFGYDFRVSEVLKSETEATINRVFTIRFPDQEKAQALFSDLRYKQVRDESYEQAVATTVYIAQ